jgi:hypothetical protein
MRTKRLITKCLHIAILLAFAWTCTSCSNGARAQNITGAAYLKLVTSFSLHGTRGPITAHLNQADSAVYLIDQGSGRILRADWKTQKSGGWREISSAGCALPHPPVAQIAVLQTQPFLVAVHCGGVGLVDRNSMSSINTFPGKPGFRVERISLSPDEHLLAISIRKDRDHANTRVYEIQDPSKFHEFAFSQAVFTSDSAVLAAPIYRRSETLGYQGDKCGIAFYDANSGAEKWEWTRDVYGGDQICPQQPLLFSNLFPDRIITDSFAPTAVAEWGARTGKLLETLHFKTNDDPAPGTESVSISSDGRFVAVVRSRSEFYHEYGIVIWDLKLSRAVYEIPLGLHWDPTLRATFSVDGNQIAFVKSNRVEVYEYQIQP